MTKVILSTSNGIKKRSNNSEKVFAKTHFNSQKYPTILNLECDKEELTARLSDGRSVSVPLAWFPRLRKVTSKQLNNFELAFDGEDITWPELDEDISVKTFIEGLNSSCC